MAISFKQLKGLDEERILAVVEPVLASHRVDAVELVWKGDREGQVLELTLEKPGSQRSGEGITIDLCSEISRQISAALDEGEVIAANYRLEVGSPGVERALYQLEEFARFAGQEVKIKTHEPLVEEGFIGQKSVRGVLFGVEGGRIIVSTDHGDLALEQSRISSARLVFSWGTTSRQPKRSGSASARRSRAKKN